MYEKIDAYVRRLIRESTPEKTVWNIEKIHRENRRTGTTLTAA